jgi:hypothetical protein
MRAKTYLLALSMAALGALTTGCQASECADLEVICARCEDAFIQNACETVVEENDADACEDGLNAFPLVCP